MKIDYKTRLKVSKIGLMLTLFLLLVSGIMESEFLLGCTVIIFLISSLGFITFKKMKTLHEYRLDNIEQRIKFLKSKLKHQQIYKYSILVFNSIAGLFGITFIIGTLLLPDKNILFNVFSTSVIWFMLGGWVNGILIYQKHKLRYVPHEIQRLEHTLKEQISQEIEEAKQKREEANKIKQQEDAKIKKEKEFREKQLAKGLVEYKNKWYTKSELQRVKSIEIGLANNFMGMNPYEFESFIAELFKKMGYKIQITPKSQDYGIDVVAKGYGDIVAIQCKRFGDGNNVSNRDIQMARGSMDYYNANKCIVVTNQDFTINAKEQARRTKNMELWGKRELHKLVKRYFIENTDEKPKSILANQKSY